MAAGRGEAERAYGAVRGDDKYDVRGDEVT